MNLSHKLINLFARAMLLLGLAASGAAWAVCDVSLITVFANGQAVLKADCSPPPPAAAPVISSITWFRDGAAIPGVTNLLLTIPTTQDIYYTTAITTGTSTYTAIGNPTGTPILAGKAATITTGQTALHVAASVGGTVTSNPAGISCTSAGGATCEAAFPMGAPVTLTTSNSAGYSFSNWAGDCTGTGVCVLSMSAPRTVVATFGSTPVCTLSASPNPITAGSSSTLTASCSPAATSYVWTGGNCSGTSPTCTVTPSVGIIGYTVAGVNGGGTGAASPTVNVTVNPLQPSCTLAANPSSVNVGTATNVTLTATCTGSPTNYAWTTAVTPNPSAQPAAGGNASTAPLVFLSTAPQGTYSYSVVATNSGGNSNAASASVTVSNVPPPSSCTLTPSPSSFIAGTATNVTLTASCAVGSPSTYTWAAPPAGAPAVTGTSSTATAAFPATTTVGTYLYSVTANGPGGPSAAFTAQVTVNVAPPPAPTGCNVVDATTFPSGNSYLTAPVQNQPGTQDWAFKVKLANLISTARLTSTSTRSSPYGTLHYYTGGTGLDVNVEIANSACASTPPANLTATTCAMHFSGFGSQDYLSSTATDAQKASMSGVCWLPAPDASGNLYINVHLNNNTSSSNAYWIYWENGCGAGAATC